jgi:enamine deaminase RidA (YjgF/YER057c/UK114 family)
MYSFHVQHQQMKWNCCRSGKSYLQTKRTIQIIEKSLKKIDSNLTAAVRTRTHVTNIEEWKLIGRAHAESSRDIQPATTMVEVERLTLPKMLVETEADAILKQPTSLHLLQLYPP